MDFISVTMVGTLVSCSLILKGRVILDNNFMRHVYVLASKVLRLIAMMDGMFVPVDRLFTRIINFLDRLGRLLFFLLWFFFLRIFIALIQLLVSQLVRLPLMVSKMRIILNLRWYIFIIMTHTYGRLVVIVVSMVLFNVTLFDLLNIVWRVQPW